MMSRRRVRLSRVVTASIAGVAALVLGTAVVSSPAWGGAAFAADPLPPVPSGMPAVGTIANPSMVKPAPANSMAADPKLQAAQKLQSTLSATQKTAITQVVARHKGELDAALKAVPAPPPLPSSAADGQNRMASASQPAPPDPAKLKASLDAVQRVQSKIDAEIATLLTPAQRELLKQSLPSVAAPAPAGDSDSPPAGAPGGGPGGPSPMGGGMR